MSRWPRAGLIDPLMILAPIAVCAAIACCRAKVYLGDDAATYVDAARSLAAGHGYVINNENAALPWQFVPNVLWPPGFSLLIAALVASGCDATWASWAIGLVGYGAFVALFVRLAARSLGTATAWVVGALLVLSPRLWVFATAGLSDVPFLVAVTLAVVAIGVRSTPWRVALLAASMAAAVYLRYVGVFLFPAIIAVALLTRTRLSLRQALVACTVAGLATLPLLLRNIAVSATVAGSRPSTNRTLLENLCDVGIGVANLFLPSSIFNRLSERVDATGSLIMGFMLLAGIVWLLLRTASSTRGEERAEPVRVLAVVSLSYLGTLVLLRTVIIFDPLTEARMLLPVLPVLVLLGAQAFVGAWQQAGAARALALGAVLPYAGLAMVLGARGNSLRFVYPDLGYIASSVQVHVPSGSCIAYERPTEEGLWTGRLVRLRLPQYRAVFVPDELLARSDVARALSDWGRATGCRYVVSMARPLNGGSTAEAWAFRHDSMEVRLQAAHALSGDGDPMLEVAYRDSRVSILHLTDARPTLPAQR